MATIIVNSPEMENKWNFILEVEDLTKKTFNKHSWRNAVKIWMGNSNPIITQTKEPQRKWMFLCKERSSQILTNVKTKASGVTDSLLYESCKQGILLNRAGTRAVQVDTRKNFFTRRTDPRADPEQVGPDIPRLNLNFPVILQNV